MGRVTLRRLAIAAVLGLGAVATAAAQTSGKPEKYNATAVNMGSGPSAAGRVLVSVERWTTAPERESLLKVFTEKGGDKLLDALMKMPKVGYIRLPNTIAWDLRYAFESPLPEGGRKVVLVTDRPMTFNENVNQERSVDYPFTLIEIHFDRNGDGVGKLSVRTKISLSKDKKTMELENYGTEPMRLTEVRIEK